MCPGGSAHVPLKSTATRVRANCGRQLFSTVSPTRNFPSSLPKKSIISQPSVTGTTPSRCRRRRAAADSWGNRTASAVSCACERQSRSPPSSQRTPRSSAPGCLKAFADLSRRMCEHVRGSSRRATRASILNAASCARVVVVLLLVQQVTQISNTAGLTRWRRRPRNLPSRAMRENLWIETPARRDPR